MKNCDEICEMISMYIDTQLDSDLLKEFEAHIESCKSCREELEETKHIISLSSSLDEEELPEHFKEQLHSKLLAVKETENSESKLIRLMLKLTQKNNYLKICSSIAAVLLLVVFAKGFFSGIKLVPASAGSAHSTQAQSQNQVQADQKTSDSVTAGEFKDFEKSEPKEDKKTKNFKQEESPIPKVEGARNKAGVLYDYDKNSGKDGADNSVNADSNNGDASRNDVNSKPKAAEKRLAQPAPTDDGKQNAGVQFSIATIINTDVIKSSSITVKTDSLDEGVGKINALAASVGGIPSVGRTPYDNPDEKSTPAPDEKILKLNIKVPDSRYDEFTEALKKNFGDAMVELGTVSTNNDNTEGEAQKTQDDSQYVFITITIDNNASP